jgi:hypothetical protein
MMKNPANRKESNPLERIGKILAFALLLLSLSNNASASSGTRMEIDGIDGGKAILKLASDPLRTMTPTPFHLTLTDGTGKPITGAEVRCDLTMPAMPMPENRPAVREKDGFYWGEAVFTMAGAWQAAFQVAMPDGRLEILLFDIERVLLK